MADSYKISLGIDFNDGELKNIKKQLTNLTDNTHRIRIDIDNSRLLKQIEHAKKELKELNSAKGNQPSLTVNTQSLEKSLSRVADVIDEVKKSLGTLDDKSGMKSLISSVNQIATALGKVENESDSLLKSLSALSKKDFSINVGIDMGKSNPIERQAAYGNKVRNETLPQLKEQARALEDYVRQHYNAADDINAVFRLIQGSSGDYYAEARKKAEVLDLKNIIGDNKASLSSQINAYKEYIKIIREAASLKPDEINLDGIVSQFSRTTDEIVKDAQDVQTGAKDIQNAFKGLFGGSLDVEGLSGQLQPIITGLGEIKSSIDGLSKIDSLNNLTLTLNRLSDVLENLSSNFASVQKYFDSLGASSNSLNNLVDNTSQGLNNNANILEKFKNSLRNIGMGTDEIDAVANRIQNLGIQIETLDQKRTRAAAKGKKKSTGTNILSVDISGTDKDGNVVKFTEQYNIANGRLVKSIEDVSTAQKKAGATTNTFVKQQKNAVTDLTNQINKLNNASIDQNASKPIKDETHLTGLSDKYNEIISAIQRMGNASSSTFDDERNNVKTLIAEYQSLVREYKNAETVATSLRSKDINTVKSTYDSKLDVLISKMRKDGVYTSGFESGAENLRSILSDSTDASGLVKFLNGLDKLEAGYKRASAARKEFNQSEKVGINVSGLESKITNLQRISPEIDKFETKINGATVSVKTLLDDLGNVKTQGDFSVVNKRFDAFEKAAEAAGITVKETVANVKSDFDKLKRLAKEMGKVDIELAKVDNVDDFNSLKRLANDLESEYKDLYDTIGKNLNADQLRELDQIFANTTGAVRELNNEMAKSAEASELTSGLERLKTIAKEINGLKLDIFKFEDTDDIERAINQLNELENEAAELRATLQQKYNITSFDEIDDISRQGEEALNSLIAEAEEAKNKLAKSIKADIELGNVDNQMDTMIAKFNSLSDANDELRRSYDATKDAYKAMMDAASTNTGDEVADRERLIQAEKEYAAALEKTNNLIKKQARADKINADAIKLQDNRDIFQAKIDTWLTKNSAATKQFGNAMLKLKAQAESCDQVTLNHLEKQFKKLDTVADKAGLKVESLGDRIKSKFKEYSAYLSVAEVFMYISQGMQDMFEQVKLIDSAMTELKKVTNETDASYNQFLSNAASRAKAIGTTIDGLVTSTADFARLGYGFKESQELAEVANIYAVVGDEIDGVEGATESLISTMTAFGIEASNSMSIVDKFNIIGNNFAISSGGIGEALERSASSMAAANNSLDETIALITAANTVVQDPASVGQAFKTNFLNCLYVQKCA